MKYRIFFLSISLLAFTVTQLTFSAAAEAKRRRLDSLASPFCTDLYLIASYGELSELRANLAEPGCDVNIQNASSLNTVLSGAINRKNENIDFVRAILSANGDPNLVNSKNQTALHSAAMRNNPDICELLISHKAKRYILDENGETAEDMAHRLSLETPAKYLEDLRIAETVHLLKKTSICPEIGIYQLIVSFLRSKR